MPGQLAPMLLLPLLTLLLYPQKEPHHQRQHPLHPRCSPARSYRPPEQSVSLQPPRMRYGNPPHSYVRPPARCHVSSHDL